MAAPRTTITPDKQAIKAVDKALIRAAGGIEAAAASVRVGKSLLSDYGRPDNECFMPGDVRADLEAITHGMPGHPIATRHAALQLGYALVRLPTGLPTGSGLHQALCDDMTEAGELHRSMIEALGDGRVDRDEARLAMKLALESAEATMRLFAMLEQIVEAE